MHIDCCIFSYLTLTYVALFEPRVCAQSPVITVKAYDTKPSIKDVTVTYASSKNDSILTKENQRFTVVCSALYFLNYTVDVHGAPQPVLKLTRNTSGIPLQAPFHYGLQYGFYTAGTGTSGSVTCSFPLNSKLSSTIYFFSQDGNYFVNGNKTIQIPLHGRPHGIIPCPSSYYPQSTEDPAAMLEHRNSTKEPFSTLQWKYEEKLGFIVPPKDQSYGEYKCSRENDFMHIHYVQPQFEDLSETKAEETLQLHFSRDTNRLSCLKARAQKKTDHYEIDKLVDIQCRNPGECDLLLRECYENWTSCESLMVEGRSCPSSRDCQTIPESRMNGMAFCTAGNVTLVDYHFVGLNRIRYWLTKQDESIPEKALIDMDEVDFALYTDKTVLFYCQALSFVFVEQLQFSVVYKNGTETHLPQGSYVTLGARDKELEQRRTIGIIHAGIRVNLTEDMREIRCMAPWYNSSDWLNKTRKFVVSKVSPPEIHRKGGQNSFVLGDEGRHLICSTSAHPYPKFKWLKHGTELIQDSDHFISSYEGESILKFGKLHANLSGEYECFAMNRLGNDSFTFQVEVLGIRNMHQASSRLSQASIIGLSVGLIVVTTVAITVISVLLKKYNRTKKKLRNLTQEEINEFIQGRPNARPLDGDYQDLGNPEYLPFNEQYEISENEFSLDETQVLGKGQFGLVLRSKYKNEEVAVKMTFPSADISYFKALLNELKVMAYIGQHPHVVRFIGAATRKIEQRKVYLVVELCPLGNLEQYIKEHRNKFVNFVVNNRIYKSVPNFENFETNVTTLDLVKWCAQVADGMEHLASKRVIHGDLASRNVLLYTKDIVKITDFGLSRQMFERANYVKKKQGPMPWRLMAIESLQDMAFSVESDVWGFGVTAWEIFSLAQVPYPCMTWSAQFLRYLVDGHRLPRPKYATYNIYVTLLKCWDSEPSCRPTFTELKGFFQVVLNGAGLEAHPSCVYETFC